MKKRIIANKLRTSLNGGLYTLVLKRIESCKKYPEETVPFSKIFSKLCVSLQITKSQCWELLYLLNDCGRLQIICGHGVKLEK